MKKVLAITLMLLLLATAAICAENNWRITLKADNGAGVAPAPGAQLGVYPTSVDGLDTQDGTAYTGLSGDTPGTAMHVGAAVDGQSAVYGKTIKQATVPAPEKIWTTYVAANVNSVQQVIRLRLFTVSATTFPTTTIGGKQVKYFIRLADNKGMAGAPVNGTQWEIPVPTAHSTTVPFWEAPINLPVIVLSEKSNAALASQGYVVQLVQVVPEPSSLLALGTGLVGLVGFARRRRA